MTVLQQPVSLNLPSGEHVCGLRTDMFPSSGVETHAHIGCLDAPRYLPAGSTRSLYAHRLGSFPTLTHVHR